MKKILLIVTVLLIAIIAGLLLYAPEMARKYAIEHSKEYIGRQIDLEKVEISYFSGSVKLVNFKLFEPNGNDVFMAFDTLFVNTKPLQFFSDRIVVQQFFIEGLKANIVQNDSTFNFDDIPRFLETADTIPANPNEEPTNYIFELSNLELRNGMLIYEDKLMSKTFTTSELHFRITYISFDQENSSEAGFKFSFNNGGFFQSKIDFEPKTNHFNIDLTVDKLDIEPFYEYTLPFASLGSLEGNLNSSLKIVGNLDSIDRVLVTGSYDLLNFKTTDLRHKPLLQAEHIYGTIKKIDYFNSHYAFDTLIIANPMVYVEFYDSTINLLEAMKTEEVVSESESLTTDSIATPELFYSFDYVSIQGGIMDLVDNTAEEPFTYHLSEIMMNTDSIYSTAKWIDLYSTMLLNHRGTLVAQVGLNPENPMDIDLNYVIRDFVLSDLNIYSKRYTGFPILYGDMYYKSVTKIKGGQLSSDNKLVIHHAEVGPKVGGFYKLPLKIALYILKDRNGVINLDIPVRGDLNDPQINIRKLVWTTLKNLVMKVALAPYDLLSASLNVDPSDIKTIDFSYLDTTLSSKIERQADLLTQLEKKKPELKIELVYFNDRDMEKKEILMNEAGKKFELATGKNYKSNEDDFSRFLQQASGQDSASQIDAARFLIPQKVVDSLSLVFDQTRKNNFYNLLKKLNDSTQVKFYLPDYRSPKNVGSIPMFEVKYTMEGEEIEE